MVCPPGLHVLFIQKIEEEILVALDESLGIDLSVLELLISVSLNTLEEGRESLLLFLSEETLLFFNDPINNILLSSMLCFFHLSNLEIQHLRFFIPFAEGQLAHLVLQLHQLLTVDYLVEVFLTNFLPDLTYFKLVLLLQFLK